MTNRNSLIQGIRNRLEASINIGDTLATAASDLFELYVFSLLIRAARNEGAQVHYRDVHDQITSSLCFRASPGQIYGATHLYTHAVLDFGNNRPLLEAHIGIKVQGRAGIAHECDVCILHRQEATECRADRREPRSSKVVIAVECKYYSSRLKLELAREFLGLSLVLTRLEGDSYFVSNTFENNVAKLLATERKRWGLNIVPSSTNSLNKLMYYFQNNFQDFKVKNVP